MGKSKVIMVQGTASNAGKSVLVAALCRIFAQDGLRAAPFKAQNMSLNSAVTPDGLEIGRAQAVQAEAAGIPAMVEMNPLLLKPEADNRSQVVVMGKPLDVDSARDYYARRANLWPVVTQALDTLRAQFDVVVIEGAGSPAEINLRDYDIVNMRVARHAEAPVLLVGDIDRGGVLASLVGTMTLLEPEERERVKAFVINKFRGDVTLLDPALEMLRERTGVAVAGVVPYFTDIEIPEEDSVVLDTPQENASLKGHDEGLLDIAVIGLPHMANFDDFDPLRRESSVRLRYVRKTSELGKPDLVILPGTKTTAADLEWLWNQGLSNAITTLHERGTPVIGVCGGYQMLGRRVLDPKGVESNSPESKGLGLLPVTTVFVKGKSTHQVRAEVAAEATGILAEAQGAPVHGYEIHMGQTTREDSASAPVRIASRSGVSVDEEGGAMDEDGRVLGTYMHGLFHNEAVRRGILTYLARRKGLHTLPWAGADQATEFDKLAQLVRSHLDMGLVYSLIS